MPEIKEKLDEEVRRVEQGEDIDTPAVVGTAVFLVVAAVVAVLAGVVLLIYFLVR